MLIERPFPAATSCVLVGRVPADLGERLHSFAHVAWIVDAAGSHQPPIGLRSDALQIFTLEKIVTTGFQPVLDKFIARSPRYLPSIFVSENVQQMHGTRYEQLIAELFRSLESHHRARVTRQKDGFTWQRQLLENLPAYTASRLPESWRNALSGLPAFVCGAGPSLDFSGPALARVADRGVIFSADSALRSLDKLGVAADFVVSVDAAKVPEKCLPSAHRPTRAILSGVSPPAWRKVDPSISTTFLSSNQITFDWIASQGIARTPIAVAENCGATGIELARYLGCSPIYLFGIDLALAAEKPEQRHTGSADATLYEKSGFESGQTFPRVPGNYSAKVPTHVLGDWTALDARLATWPADLVHNVTDRGARLSNTTLTSPSSFLVVPTRIEKQLALEQLDEMSEKDFSPCSELALVKIRQLGQRVTAVLPDLLRILDHQGAPALTLALRQLLADQDLARCLGAFSLKLMPHLIPPIEGDTAFWKNVLTELSVLAELAGHVHAEQATPRDLVVA